MKNVYERIRLYFNHEEFKGELVKREWVEGFLRLKAWQGLGDKELGKVWSYLQFFMQYLRYSDHDSLEELTVRDYSFMIEWLTLHNSKFPLSLAHIRRYLTAIMEFYQYLAGKRIVDNAVEVENATEEIAGGKKIRLLRPSATQGLTNWVEEDAAKAAQRLFGEDEDTVRFVGQTIEQLMVQLGAYFQERQFHVDFDRALYLYTGPLESVPDHGQEDFWLGFWDYFLFDYHLLKNGETPLKHFYQKFDDRLQPEQRTILQDLMSARFTVFYVNRIINQEWLECVNLLTGEKFQLPFMFEYATLKKLLFFGHIFSQGLVMINYVTSMEVSPNLRRRIKDEVLRQLKIYQIQEPKADMAAFLNRHALVIRHTIDILVNVAKVNVTPFSQLEREFPVIPARAEPDAAVAAMITHLMQEHYFSEQDNQLVQKLWADYCQLVDTKVRKPAVWAAAAISTFVQINFISALKPERLAKTLGISEASLYKNRSTLYKTLQLQPFDPRYLNEEGFVISLFML